MDSERFDSLVRSFGARRNRRSVVKSFGAAALGAAGVIGLRNSAGAAKGEKVSICHLDEYGGYNYISVSSNAIPAHIAHGDAISPDFTTDLNHCGGCGNVCGAPANASATCGESGCGFTCDEGYQLNEAGDACESASLCSPGYEALNGGCFQIVGDLDRSLCDNDVCHVFGSVNDSFNYLCALRSGSSCTQTSDCPTGQACHASRSCIAVC